jgi:hypothetical protein
VAFYSFLSALFLIVSHLGLGLFMQLLPVLLPALLPFPLLRLEPVVGTMEGHVVGI